MKTYTARYENGETLTIEARDGMTATERALGHGLRIESKLIELSESR